jgi:hypothetical protein
MNSATVFSAQELGGGTVAYSSALGASNLIPDYAAIQLTLSATGIITITQQCSLDGSSWQDPTSSTAAALGSILTGVTRALITYIPFTPVIAPYVRLVLTTSVTIPSVAVKVVTSGDVR